MAGAGDESWIERVEPGVPVDLNAFTGERYLPGIAGEIEAEHVHRYLFAAGLCAGKDVLDIACGEGYGSALLGRVAASVVGVDVDEKAVEHARAAYGTEHVEFDAGTCESIPYKRDSFDVVVSFETIEHIEDQDAFLREVRRVLRPGGLLICSTPDTAVYKHPDGKNPYHKHELTRDEFERLLKRRFENVGFFGQRLVSGSVITRGDNARTERLGTSDGRSFTRESAEKGAKYLVALCSDARLPRAGDSLLDDARYTIGMVTSLQERRRVLERERQELAQRAARVEGQLSAATPELRRLGEEVSRLSQERGRLAAERDAATAERDTAIRDAAAAEIEYQRSVAELERVREEMIAAREKAAAAMASEASSRNERETMRVATREAQEARLAAEIELARVGERLSAVTGERDRLLRTPSVWRGVRWLGRLVGTAWDSATWTLLRAAGRAARVLGLPGRQRLEVARRARLVRRSAMFDRAYYLQRNPDVRLAGIDPAWHFAARGGLERRDPGPAFDTGAYLDTNPDVAAAGVHPFEHFVTRGAYEGRVAHPVGQTPKAQRGSPLRIEGGEPVHRPAPRVGVDPTQLARTKVLAFYLPQFHPIPENDAWWGKGFTEWANVSRGRPMFRGHAQPVLPGELGFYDLRVPEVREHQAELARGAGIHGFCYYHYWFNGRRVLERPLDEVLRTGSPDFPFCVCWANENWTRRWDGQEQELLLEQRHTLASDRRFMLDLIPCLEDERYVRVDGRPVVLVYRPDLMVDAADTAAVWRDECRRAGIGEVHLCAVQYRTGDPRPMGFDAAVEFPPHHFPAPEITGRVEGLDPSFGGAVFDFEAGARELIARPRRVDYRLYRGVMPSWDNTARRMEQAMVHHGSSPALYQAWLSSAINQRQPEDGVHDNLVFVNAWNEWAEGAVLEPRRDLGDAYLRATARVLGVGRPAPHSAAVDADGMNPLAHDAHTHEALAPNGSASSIEVKLKRIVRGNGVLNRFVNRHPAMKGKAAALVRRAERTLAPAAPVGRGTPSGVSAVRWRGAVKNAGGPRLLVVSHDAARAGAQLIVLENLRHWAGHGIDCRVVLLGSGPLESEFVGLFPTTCLDGTPPGDRGRAFGRVLDDLTGTGWRPDAAFCNTVASAEAMSVCAERGIGVVSAVYELPTSIDSSLGGRKTIDTVLRCSRRVMVASEFVQDRLSAAYGIDRETLVPVHTGVLGRTLPDRNESRARVRRELGVGRDAFVVLGCGSIHHRKGSDLFVQAAAHARDALPGREIVFAWVGEDQCGTTFRAWCNHDVDRLGLHGVVRFMGGRPDPGAWFAGADVFALTSREDPFPMVCLEALQAGRAVLAFEGAGGASEVLGDGRGVLVPYADTAALGREVARLARDPAHLAGLEWRAAAFAAERLGWERYMDDIARLLADCADRFGVIEAAAAERGG